MNQERLGGLGLFVGSVIVLATIWFEHRVGWLGVGEGDGVPFIRDHWPQLRSIWGWQAVGQGIYTVSSLLLLKAFCGWRRTLWALLFLSGLLITGALLATIVGYGPAIEVYGQDPSRFEAVRGAIWAPYAAGRMGLLVFLPTVLIESFGTRGVVGKGIGGGTMLLVALATAAGPLLGLPIKLSGASWFFLPLVLGISLWHTGEDRSS